MKVFQVWVCEGWVVSLVSLATIETGKLLAREKWRKAWLSRGTAGCFLTYVLVPWDKFLENKTPTFLFCVSHSTFVSSQWLSVTVFTLTVIFRHSSMLPLSKGKNCRWRWVPILVFSLTGSCVAQCPSQTAWV